MKYKKIFLLIVILVINLVLNSCNEFTTIKKNQLMSQEIDRNDMSSLTKTDNKKLLTEEEAKLEALEILEKYFDIKLYLTEVDCYIRYDSKDIMKKNLEKINFKNDDIQQFKNTNSILENGIYNITFSNKQVLAKPIDDLNESKIEEYNLRLNGKTGELLSYNSFSLENDNRRANNLTEEEAINLAKKFIEKSDIGNITNVKSLQFKREEISQDNIYFFTTRGSEASDEIINILIDGNTKKINFISIGLVTLYN